MPQSDVFAMDHSPFNNFLFSEVGCETNGSSLTVLSLFARVGTDPWAEAACWVARPRSTNIERLAELIRMMPLSAASLLDARATATRLIQLLPSRTLAPSSTTPIISTSRLWLIAAAFCAAIGVSLLVNHLATPALVGTPTPQTEAATPPPVAGVR